jgi:hypothetical protein
MGAALGFALPLMGVLNDWPAVLSVGAAVLCGLALVNIAAWWSSVGLPTGQRGRRCVVASIVAVGPLLMLAAGVLYASLIASL